MEKNEFDATIKHLYLNKKLLPLKIKTELDKIYGASAPSAFNVIMSVKKLRHELRKIPRERVATEVRIPKKAKNVSTNASVQQIPNISNVVKYDIKQMVSESLLIYSVYNKSFLLLFCFEQFDNDNPTKPTRKHLEAKRQTVASCNRCFDSPKLEKHLIVAQGKSVYLAIPCHEGLTHGHCIITTMAHSACTSQFDEDVWTELRDFMIAVRILFSHKLERVLFFEMATDAQRKCHLEIHCVPSKEFKVPDFIWSSNEHVVDLRRVDDIWQKVPKDLPYFWITIGTDRGFAYVNNEQDKSFEQFAKVSLYFLSICP